MICLRRRGVAQPGSARALGARGRGFESHRPDHSICPGSGAVEVIMVSAFDDPEVPRCPAIEQTT